MAYRPIPPLHGACPDCDQVLRVTPGKAWGRVRYPAALFVHGPRAGRCPGSRQQPQPWLQATRLPGWDQMTSLDQGAALLHTWKRQREGPGYAIDNYPARYFDHPDLTSLDPRAASRHAAATGPWQATVTRLGWDTVDQLYNTALQAERRRDQEAAYAGPNVTDGEPAASEQARPAEYCNVRVTLDDLATATDDGGLTRVTGTHMGKRVTFTAPGHYIQHLMADVQESGQARFALVAYHQIQGAEIEPRSVAEAGGGRDAEAAGYLESLQQLSEAWCSLHPAVDGDNRSPYEVLTAGVITEREFWDIVLSDDTWVDVVLHAAAGAYQAGRAYQATQAAAQIQADLRGVIADHAREGNDAILGALLDAVRELHVPDMNPSQPAGPKAPGPLGHIGRDSVDMGEAAAALDESRRAVRGGGGAERDAGEGLANILYRLLHAHRSTQVAGGGVSRAQVEGRADPPPDVELSF